MQITTLEEITNGQQWVGLGIAGNQAEHLDQAGEAEDFKDVVALENAPKGMFPWFIPNSNTFLATNPLSSDTLTHNGESILQPEPEISLVVEFQYSDSEDELVEGLTVIGFSAFNDCSRRANEPKISLKKNWGAASQGMANTVVRIDDFPSTEGAINSYRLACYLKREGELIQYGKDTAVSDYCYFNQQLIDWITNQLNTQQDHGPLEAINAMLEAGKPRYAVIGIGATCYTDFGNSEQRFLAVDDEIFVAAYDNAHFDPESIESQLKSVDRSEGNRELIVLQQKVVANSPAKA